MFVFLCFFFFSGYPALTTSCQYVQISPWCLCPHPLIFFSCSKFFSHSLQTYSLFASKSVFLTVFTCSSFSYTYIISLSCFSSYFLILLLPPLLSLSLSLCSCQSGRRSGQTHSHPQRVTQRGHCQQGLLTAWCLLSRADTGDKLDPCSWGSCSVAAGVAAVSKGGH